MLNGLSDSKASNSEFAETIRQKSPLIEPKIKTINQKTQQAENGALKSNGHSGDGEYIETAVLQRPINTNPEPFPEFQPAEEKQPEAFTSTIPQ